MIPGIVSAQKSLGMEEFRSIDELTSAIIGYFPRVQGDVISVEKNKMAIALGKKDGLKNGMILTLWREGEEIVHPVTGVCIGREEDNVGSVEIVQVGEKSSAAMITEAVLQPLKGDRARITPKNINIAIIPLEDDRTNITAELTERLAGCGRFTVLGSDKVEAYLKDKKEKDSTVVKELGGRFGLDAVVAIGIYPSEGASLVTVKMFYAEDARQLATIVGKISHESPVRSIGEIKPFFAPAPPERDAARNMELPFAAEFLVMADFDADGTMEYFFSDGKRLSSYHKHPSGWREVWKEPAAWKKANTIHLYLDAADINGNGKPELFLTAKVGNNVTSMVIEARDGSYHRVAQLPVFLRVVSYPGRGRILIGQDFTSDAFFTGTPRQYTWTGEHYDAGVKFPLPGEVMLYGFVFADLGERSPLLVALDEKDHLVVFSGDTRIWKSSENYPGKNVIAVEEGLDLYNLQQEITIKGRLFAVDSNGDGRDEIVLPRNTKKIIFSGYRASELHGMRWTGARLEQAWSIKDIPAGTIDFQVNRKEGGGVFIYALLKHLGGIFKKNKTEIAVYASN